MKTKETPDWAIAKIGGIRAEEFFELAEKRFKEAKRAYSVMHQTYQMTHLKSFRDAAQAQVEMMNRIREAVRRNNNLYCILKKGYSLN